MKALLFTVLFHYKAQIKSPNMIWVVRSSLISRHFPVSCYQSCKPKLREVQFMFLSRGLQKGTAILLQTVLLVWCLHKCRNVNSSLLFYCSLNYSVFYSCITQSPHVVRSRDSGKCLHHFRECGPWRKPLVDRQHWSQNHRVSKSTTGFNQAHFSPQPRKALTSTISVI